MPKRIQREGSRPWARGHGSDATCLGCGRGIAAKPTAACTEAQHLTYYNNRRIRNNAYRRERRAAARAEGTVYRAGRGDATAKAVREAERHVRLRRRLFELLGSAECVRCGFGDERALHFDHINGGGRQHRMTLRSGSAYYRQLATMPTADLRATFQVLCANCNAIKRVENQEWRRA